MGTKNKSKTLINYKIDEKGSLGLLALGDIGLREWRKVRNELTKNSINEEE